jgi:hypothetical protein
MMKFALRITSLVSLFGITACISAPSSAIFNDKSVPVVSALSMSCSAPWELAQDCSNMSGGTRRIKLGGLEMRAAGTADGKIVYVRNAVRSRTPAGDEAAANAVIDLSKQNGVNLIKVDAAMTGSISSGFILTFNADAYTKLKSFTAIAE